MGKQPELIIDDRVVMLLYRLIMDHKGMALLSEAESFGVWAEASIDAATTCGLVRKETSTDSLEITSDGREALW